MSGSVLSSPDEIRAFISQRVAEGFDAEDDIVEETLEFFEEEYGEDPAFLPLVQKMVIELLDVHMQEQSKWLEETDCDKLDRAFDELEQNGIVSRQNFTCCQTCGHAEIWEEVEQAKQDSEIKGYVFYHWQDTERAVEEGRLYLAYGALDSSDDATKLVAQSIVDTIQKHGFKVDWNGSLDKRICVEDIKWRRRRSA
jgi:hypothetical protein